MRAKLPDQSAHKTVQETLAAPLHVTLEMHVRNVRDEILGRLHDKYQIVHGGPGVRSDDQNITIFESGPALERQSLQGFALGNVCPFSKGLYTLHYGVGNANTTARIASFKSRCHLSTQRTLARSCRRYQPVFQVCGQSEIGLYVFRGHTPIIQAKCLHASKHTATLRTKRNAT